MFISEIKDKKMWEDFLFGCQEKTFLQSWNWGEFQKMMGNKIWRLGIDENNKNLLAVALVIKVEAKRGKFLFVPHGPALRAGNSKPEIRNPKPRRIPSSRGGDLRGRQIQNSKFKILNVLLERLKKIAKEEKVDFIRMASVWENSKENLEIFQNLGFKTAPIHIHPEVTWLLDISLPEEEILRKMRKNTRNLIRRAKKEGVEIFQENSLEGVKKFNEIYQATVSRHHFAPFSFQYLKNEFLAFSKDNQIIVFFAKHQDKLLASAMIIYWQGIAFYHQGASVPSKVPAPYLLQWEAIKQAKKRKCQLYNFWGITPEIKTPDDLKNPKIKKHPWWGLSLFKMGFGGYMKEYLKTQDLVLSKKYWLNYFIEKSRKIRRGY